MSHYELLKKESGDLADHIACCLDSDGKLSGDASKSLSILWKDIQGYISDYISEVQSEHAEAASHCVD